MHGYRVSATITTTSLHPFSELSKAAMTANWWPLRTAISCCMQSLQFHSHIMLQHSLIDCAVEQPQFNQKNIYAKMQRIIKN